MRDLFKAHIYAMGKTIAGVEKELGITGGALRSWLDGRTRIPVSNLRKIADYLGITIDELIEEINNETLHH